MDNIIDWFENFVWIFLIVAAITFIVYQTGIIDGMAELVAKIVFKTYMLN